MTPRILIVFGSSYGQTEKIAKRIAAELRERHFDVELCDAGKGSPRLLTDQYDAVLVGSSLIARGHQKPIEVFVAENAAILNRMPSGFFQVSASAGSAKEAGRAAAQRMLDEFLVNHRWTPVLSASIAGAINYTKYGYLLRWYMKRASAKNGGATDTSRDHEYTDWTQVARFAQAFAKVVQPVAPVVLEPALSA